MDLCEPNPKAVSLFKMFLRLYLSHHKDLYTVLVKDCLLITQTDYVVVVRTYDLIKFLQGVILTKYVSVPKEIKTGTAGI